MEGRSRVYQPHTLACRGCQSCNKFISTILLRRFFRLIIRIILFLLLFLFVAVSFEMLDLAVVPTFCLGLSGRLMSPIGFGFAPFSLLALFLRSSTNNQGLIGGFKSFLRHPLRVKQLRHHQAPMYLQCFQGITKLSHECD
jgi:hypothetical protein